MAGKIKRKCLVCFFVLVSMFAACGCRETKSEETVSYAPEDSAVSFSVQTKIDGHPVEIPVFSSVHESTQLAEINREIDDTLGTLYEKDKDSAEITPEIRTDLYENPKYLQALCRYVEFPLVGGQGDVVSYNYDRVHDKQITLTDALILKETTLDDVRQAVTDSCLREKDLLDKEITVYGVTVDGFVLDEENHCDLYGNIDFSLNGKTQWSYIYRYEFENGTLEIYDLQ